MDILSSDGNSATFAPLRLMLGLTPLASVLSLAGIFSAVIIILCSVITLFVANYPKTVAQTKEKIITGLSTIAYIAAFPFLADVIYTIIYETFFK